MRNDRASHGEAILQDGDTFDVNIYRKTRYRAPMIIFSVGALTLERSIEGSNILAFAGITAGALTGSALQNRYKNRKETKHAEALQQSARDAMKEPVDIIRVPQQKDLEATLHLRWYGMDNIHPDDIVDVAIPRRMRRIAKYCRSEDIDTIIFGNDTLNLSHERIHKGATVVSDLKQQHLKQKQSLEVNDTSTDDKVIQMDLVEFEELADRLMAEQPMDAMETIIEKLNHTALKEAYEIYCESGDDLELRTFLRRYIERYASENDVMIDKSNGTFDRYTVEYTAHLSDDMVSFQGRYTNKFGEARSAESNPSQSLYQIAGVSDAEELNDIVRALVESSDSVGAHSKNELVLVIKLYYSLLDDDEDSSIHGPVYVDDESNAQYSSPTMFQEIARNSSLRTNERIFYRQHKPDAKIAARAIVACGAITYGAFAGAFIGAQADDATRSEQLACINDANGAIIDEECRPGSATSPDGAAYVRYLTSNSGFSEDRAIIETKTAIDTMNLKVSDAVAWMLFEKLHINLPDKRLDDSSYSDLPPGLYAQDKGESFIGDVDSRSNKTVYWISSPAGLNKSGYWYSNVSNEMRVDLNDSASNAFTYLNSIPTEVKPFPPEGEEGAFDPATADYEVFTEYVGAASENRLSQLDLPVLEGYQVAKVDLIDTAGKQSEPLAILKDSFGGYATAVDSNMVRKLNFKSPAIKYWLIPSEKSMQERSAQQVEFLGSASRGSELVDRQAIGSELRAELGLTSNASDEDVLDAIKYGKTYSYTPMQRAGIKALRSDENDIQGVIEEVGSVLAGIESANCNIASTTYLLSTIDSGKNYNYANGFLDNGDGKLTQQEAHAWIVDDHGRTIDPTPVKLAPGESRRDSAPDTNSTVDVVNPLTGTLALSIAIGFVAHRRRHNIRNVIDAAMVNAVLSSKKQQTELQRRLHELYAKPGSTFQPSGLEMTTRESARLYAANIPENSERKSTLRFRLTALADGAIRRYDSK